ncbi:tRNA (guanine(9)-N(1))-methyltransferase [Sporobolomyces salmoneus]|uniref:tRNA (guanine(9)-N(1))-methyltransferase n=1 Tax=Sporobolomyces salmoneus TaxID=183962 RepID=UPI003179511B
MADTEVQPATQETQTSVPSTSSTTLETPSLPSADGADSTSANPPAGTTTESTETPPMTKSALKRQRRQELYESQKLARRAREKEKKKTKAAEKRKLVEEGVIEKTEVSLAKKRKKEHRPSALKEGTGKTVEHGARIVLDVGFDELMNEKEVKSMSSQIAYCYAANRNAINPFPILVSSFNKRLKESYDKRQDHLNWKGVEWWEDGFEKLYEGGDEGEEVVAHRVAEPVKEEAPASQTKEEVKMGVYAGRPRSTAPKSSLIYLTGDSPNVLSKIEPDHTYILGGIVDRNRYKNLCLNKANELGIQHAQLPIGQFLPEMATRKVLTVNQVYEIMVNWVESHREKKEELRKEGKTEEEIEREAEGDWRESLRKVMPERKFDKDGKAKKRAAKKAEKQKENEGDGVYVVISDESEDDYDEAEEGDAREEAASVVQVGTTSESGARDEGKEGENQENPQS